MISEPVKWNLDDEVLHRMPSLSGGTATSGKLFKGERVADYSKSN